MGVYSLIALIPLLISFTAAETTIPNTGELTNAFLYSFGGFGPNNVNLPLARSCPDPLVVNPISLVSFGGNEPAPPYILAVMANEQYLDPNGTVLSRTYTSSVSLPNLQASPVNVAFPFMNGTQFMTCMWSSNGQSGGCQDLYTVMPSDSYTNGYANASSPCRASTVMGSWLPPASKRIAVDVIAFNGPQADKGFPPACTDLKFVPKNGTGPYTLTIAPAFKPPVNITSNSTASPDNAMNYTIRLTHGQAFWATVSDKNGATFAFGPLHAGFNSNVSCLQTLTGQTAVGGLMPDQSSRASSSGGVSVTALGGGIAGAFVAGSALAALVMFFCLKKRKAPVGRNASTESLEGYQDTRPAAWRHDTHASIAKPSITPYTDLSPDPAGIDPLSYGGPRTARSDSVSNFDATSDQGERAYRQSVGLGDFHPTSRHFSSSASAPSEAGGSSNAGGSNAVAGSSAGGANGRNVYVVHSDGGGNVHITLPEGGANVVELPPTYGPSSSKSTAAPAPPAAVRDEKARFSSMSS